MKSKQNHWLYPEPPVCIISDPKRRKQTEEATKDPHPHAMQVQHRTVNILESWNLID